MRKTEGDAGLGGKSEVLFWTHSVGNAYWTFKWRGQISN